MRKMLNTLYVTTQGAYLNKEGETVVVNIERETRLRLPIHTLGSIVCFGQVRCSPFLLGHCAEQDVSVSFMTGYGQFLARVTGPVAGNVLLRREQYRRADDLAASARLARLFVLGKVANCRTVLSRALRDHAAKVDAEAIGVTVNQFARVAQQLLREEDLDNIRGLEGRAANDYFGLFDHLIVAQKEDFVFTGRNRRPPLRPGQLPALLSLHAAVSRRPLGPGGGRARPGRRLPAPRPPRPAEPGPRPDGGVPAGAGRPAGAVADQPRPGAQEGLHGHRIGGGVMDDEARKALLIAYQKRKQDEIVHPFLKEKMPLGMLLFAQAQLLARHLRGDLEDYPPFLWR